jgi:multidrug transporter EmrE-like cation transporter
MNIKLFSLILISVSLSASAQLLLKLGMSSAHVQQMLMHERLLQTVWVVASNVQVIVGLGLYALGAMVWLLVLARVDVSLAYPFVGLGFILTMALGGLVLHEPVGVARFIGTAMVVLGVCLVSRS